MTCGGVTVNPGDLVLADDEGLVVVDPQQVESLLDAALAIKNTESRVIELLDGGGSLTRASNASWSPLRAASKHAVCLSTPSS